MKQKYYIKATKDGMKAGYNDYQHKMGITKHPNSDKTNTLCSGGFHLAKSIKDAISYLSNATEFYLCKPVGKVYAEDDTKIRAGGINILWKIPMGEHATWSKAYTAWSKADATWSKANATWSKADATWSKANAAWSKANATWSKADATITMEDIIRLYEESKKDGS